MRINHVKAGGLHDWAKKKSVMDSKLEYGWILVESEAATWGVYKKAIFKKFAIFTGK